jgi:hypothetical protein
MGQSCTQNTRAGKQIVFMAKKYSIINKIEIMSVFFNLWQKTSWFPIRSLDAFERDLDAAQVEVSIDTKIPVVIKSRFF